MDKETRDFIIKQQEDLEVSIDAQFKQVDKQFERVDKQFKQVDKQFERVDARAEEIAKKLTKRIDDQAEESRRYLGALQESFQGKLETILEVVKSLLPMREQVAIMFEHIGKQEMDIAITKESVRDHEHRIKRLEVR